MRTLANGGVRRDDDGKEASFVRRNPFRERVGRGGGGGGLDPGVMCYGVEDMGNEEERRGAATLFLLFVFHSAGGGGRLIGAKKTTPCK